MKIGKLLSVMRGETEELHGSLATLEMKLTLRLVPIGSKLSEASPDYRAFTTDIDGDDVEVGGAWKKTKINPDGTSFDFLSLSIDDMSMPHALNVHAFKSDQGGWDIAWRRRQKKDAA